MNNTGSSWGYLTESVNMGHHIVATTTFLLSSNNEAARLISMIVWQSPRLLGQLPGSLLLKKKETSHYGNNALFISENNVVFHLLDCFIWDVNAELLLPFCKPDPVNWLANRSANTFKELAWKLSRAPEKYDLPANSLKQLLRPSSCGETKPIDMGASLPELSPGVSTSTGTEDSLHLSARIARGQWGLVSIVARHFGVWLFVYSKEVEEDVGWPAKYFKVFCRGASRARG